MTSAFSALLENETVKQILIWQVAGQLIAPILNPVLTEVEKAVNRAAPTTVLTPADLAVAVVRNFKDQASAADMASQSGIPGDLFQVLIDLAGDAPGPQDLAEALRRGIIEETGTGATSTSFQQGIAEGRLADKWAPVIKALSVQWPTPTDALQAYLEGQIDQATATTLYERFGGDPTYFTLLYNTRGNAPTPLEAIQMANRGIIPWTGQGADVVSYEQAFLEGPWRNKWEQPYRELGTYVPPPRTVTALVKEGAVSDQQALTWWKASGLDDATAQQYLASAHSTKTTAAKTLTEASITELYTDQLISEAEASTMLQALGYSAADAEALLQLRAYTVSKSQLNQAIGRVRTLYAGGKLTKAGAQGALNDLHVPQAQSAQLMDLWDVEAGLQIKMLSASEIASALYYQVIDQPTAMSRLQAMGYDAADAWLLLSVRAHSPLPNPPAGVVVPTPPAAAGG